MQSRPANPEHKRVCVGRGEMKGSVKGGVSWCQKIIKGSGQAYRSGKDERRG